jgi:hypothetical protein
MPPSRHPRKHGNDHLARRRRELHAGFVCGGIEQALELGAVLHQRARKRAQGLADRLLQGATFGLCLRAPGCIVMSARREADIAKLHDAIAAFFQRDLVEAELFLP